MGSLIGARVLPMTRTASLRVVFGIVVVVLAFEMIFHGITGRL